MKQSIKALPDALRPAADSMDGGFSSAPLQTDASPNSFTAHNIELDDGSLTRPQAKGTMKQHPFFLSSSRILNLVYPGDKKGLRLVDLACLEGGHTTELARLGFETLGIEVRKSNFENCLYVKKRVNLPNLNFVNDNVLNLERYGTFDVIICSGILYHLDKPKAFIETMSRCCKKIIIVSTHYATESKNTLFKLSDECINEGLPGRWFFEHEDLYIDQLEQLKWASWENKQSFWIRREYLIQTLHDSGFDIVFEQYDGLSSDQYNGLGNDIGSRLTSDEYKQKSRGIFVGIKQK